MATPSIEPLELLYRQIGPGGNPIYFDPDRSPPVDRSLFLPSKNDTDGLSLVRARFRTQEWASYRPNKPDVRFRLATLIASRLASLAQQAGFSQLRFQPTPDKLDEQHGKPWAHCVACEINRSAYDSDTEAKRRIKQWALAVADSISRDDVLGGHVKPTESTPYRP